MKKEIEFLKKINNLKKIKRKGWVVRNISNPESVADHSFRTTIFSLIFLKYENIDLNKCIKMSLIHDLGESIIGDITPFDNVKIKDKDLLEKKAFNDLLKDIDPDLVNLFIEYQEQKTKEAILVKDMDLLEMIFQVKDYQKDYKNKDFSDFYKTLDEKLKTDLGKKIYNLIKYE